MQYPTKTYRVDRENQRIVGTISEKEAYWQFVDKALSTIKYEWLYYDQYFGILNSQRYIGKDQGYIMAHFPKDMDECLLTDERTVKIDNYEYNEVAPGKLQIKCVIWSIYGSREIVKEMNI